MDKKKNKFDFAKKKDLTIKSLKEVNYFLLNLNRTVKSIKIYKWFK